MLEIRSEDLMRVLGLLIARVEQDGVVCVEHEGFWSVPLSDAFDIYKEPSEPTVGMVSDSWTNLESMVRAPESAVNYGFIWLAEVLQAIGDDASR